MALALDPHLNKLLVKHNVEEKVFAYLKEKNMLLIGQFAGLADDRADVAAGICTPAGLDASDRVVCQPVKAAWLEADALRGAELDRIRKGCVMDLDDPIDPEVRRVKSDSFIDHYHIRLPAHLIGCDALAGRMVREHERKTPNPFDVRKVKSLAYLAPEHSEKTVIEVLSSGAVQGTKEEALEPSPLTVHKFVYKHRVLMNTMALAVGPDWASGDRPPQSHLHMIGNTKITPKTNIYKKKTSPYGSNSLGSSCLVAIRVLFHA